MSVIKQKGVATVEFAIVLPLLLFLVVMVSEFGIMFYRLDALTKSVQVASRYLSEVVPASSVTGSDGESTKAKNLAVYGQIAVGTPILPNLVPGDITITNLGNVHVRVVASYDSSLILGNTLSKILGMLAGGSVANMMTLEASSVMRFSE